ncbi:hypothetical protein [Zavarzinia sp.]|uniref:hypothetical protein n=1 Tax=Zavarzinia sp. TaxID=2027920 RepID=UPI003BB63A08
MIVPGPMFLMSYEVSVFHADRPAAAMGRIPGPGGAEMTDLLFRSVRLFDADARLSVMTDDKTDLGAISLPFTRLSGPVNFSELMLERTRAQCRFLESDRFDRPVAFLDADILLNGSLAPLFARDFDVCLTWRGDELMQPFNGGAIFFNNRRPEAARRFMRRVLDRYEAAHRDGAGWFGDQMALAEAVDLPLDNTAEEGEVVRDGIRIAWVSCDIWNFSPEETPIAIMDRYAGRPVLHFKGARKVMMAPFWSLYFSAGAPRAASLPARLAAAFALAFALGRYRRAYRKANRRFGAKANAAAQRRSLAPTVAELAAGLGGTGRLVVADLECGDALIGDDLRGRGLDCDYQPFDSHPSLPAVRPLDPETSAPPGMIDLVLVVGLIECLRDPAALLARLRPLAGTMIVSHAVSDLRPLSRSKRAKMGWRRQLPAADVEAMIRAAGFKIVERRTDDAARAMVWACR